MRNPRKPRLTSDQKTEIVALRREGSTFRAIARKVGCSPSGARQFYDRYVERRTIENVKPSGRPRKISKRQERFLVRRARKEPSASAVELSNRLPIGESRTRDILRDNGLGSYRPRKVETIPDRSRMKRIAFAEEVLTGGIDIPRVVWSDESYFSIGPNFTPIWVRRPYDSADDPTYSVQARKRFTSKIMVWGCIWKNGIGSLHCTKETLNSERYIRVLETDFIPWLDVIDPDRELIFMQDNAPPHKSKETKEFLDEKEIAYLDWPPYSPDLNPIENVWAEMKRRLGTRRFYSIQSLTEAIVDVWINIEDEYIARLYDTYDRRLRRVLELKGGRTEY